MVNIVSIYNEWHTLRSSYIIKLDEERELVICHIVQELMKNFQKIFLHIFSSTYK